ncbi:MAG: dihydrofolate reductase family protein [Chloroflexota bacterium]
MSYEHPVTQLYPLPSSERPLTNLYLQQNLRQYGEKRPFVYSNYVTSLDGRIAIPHPDKPGMMVPKQIANERDWRLFQELAVQADVVISSGRYLRDYADGRAQEILSIYDKPQFADLAAWRRERHLPLYPAIALISNSLDFPIPPVLVSDERTVLVFTSETADQARINALERQGAQVFVVGKQGANGRLLVDKLSQLGYNTIYNATGPKVLHLLLAASVLHRLYLTFANRLLGGHPFSSIVEGDVLVPPADFVLTSLFFDPAALHGLGQLFSCYTQQGFSP